MSWKSHLANVLLIGTERRGGDLIRVAVTSRAAQEGVQGCTVADLRGEKDDALVGDSVLRIHGKGGIVVYVQSAEEARDLSSTSVHLDLFDVRVVAFAGETDAQLAQRVVSRITACPWFDSSRGCGGEGYDFLHVVRTGIAQDGGLFMPQHIPTFTLEDLALLQHMPYHDAATYVLESFVPHIAGARTATPQELKKIVRQAYSQLRWEVDGEGSVCPVRKVGSGVDEAHVMELFHGPTAAFKDFALQLFPKFFTKSIARSASQYVILAATSGDTGVAAINGFMQESGIAIMVLYPKNGVSAVQKKQMLACDGGNVRVVGVDADFDFCQTTVKHIFNNGDYRVHLRKSHNAVLSSANSINWGRLLPQIVYYIFAYARLVKQGVVKVGEPVDVCVPTGNFGNILSGYYAKLCGVPFRRFICASNVNNVLTDFITTGRYATKGRGLTLTASPSIDILKSSNVERFLYLLSGRDSGLVAGMMKDLDTCGEFTVPPVVKESMDTSFAAGFATEAECLSTIRDVQEKYDYLLDTHTACGYKVLRDYKQKLRDAGEKEVPVLLAATASFAKFPDAVKEGLDGASAPSLKPYDVSAVYKDIAGRASTPVPRALAQVVAQGTDLTDLHVCSKSEEKVMEMLSEFANGLKA